MVDFIYRLLTGRLFCNHHWHEWRAVDNVAECGTTRFKRITQCCICRKYASARKDPDSIRELVEVRVYGKEEA